MNENTSPLVSVLLLSMNHEPYIENCINSLANQTYDSIEIIYLDNASVDNSFKASKMFLKKIKIPSKTFQNEQSRGISENLNFLYHHSKGEYICPLSTDDWLTPDSILLKLNYFKTNPEFGMIYNSTIVHNYEDGKETIIRKKKAFKEGWVLNDLLKFNFINTVGCMIKRTTIDSVGLWDENSPLEDWDMWIRIAEKYPIGLVNKELAYYGVKNGMNITGNIEFMTKGFDYILKKYAHYKKIKSSMRVVNQIKAYNYATKHPSLKTLKYLINTFQWNLFYS